MHHGIAASLRRHYRASRRGEAGRLCFISSSLAGCSLARIVEEELIAVGIIDHQEPVTPRTLLDRNAHGLEFRAQRVSPVVQDLDRIIVGNKGNPEFTNLPRKFNITVTGCLDNCTHSESQDIALVPAKKGSRLAGC